jgi:hypothetical protein
MEEVKAYMPFYVQVINFCGLKLLKESKNGEYHYRFMNGNIKELKQQTHRKRLK